MDREIESVLWAALREVPESYREVLALYYREGRSAKQVATALGISEALVLQRLRRGREHLKAEVSRVVEQGLEALEPPKRLSGAVLAAIPQVAPPSAGYAKELFAMKGTKIAIAAVVVAAAAVGIVWTLRHSNAGAESPAAKQTESATSAGSLPPADESTAAEGSPSARTKPAGATGVRSESESTAAPAAAHGTRRDAPQDIDTVDPELLRALSVQTGHARGPDDAPVSIVVYTDFGCHYCGVVLATLDQLRDEYPVKVRVVKKLFPLKESSRRLAQASIAASEQGEFWEMHDLIFANQSEDGLTDDDLIALAVQIGLDRDQFIRDLDDETVAEIVQQEIDEGIALGVKGTPTLFVNNHRVVGARPVDVFRELVDEELEARAAGDGD